MNAIQGGALNPPSGGYLSSQNYYVFLTCAHAYNLGTYVRNATENWKIATVPSMSSGSLTQVYHNGTQVVSTTDATAVFSQNGPDQWWNFGPYWSRYKSSPPQSNVPNVDIYINGMVLTQP